MSTRSSTRPPARSAQDARQPVGAAPLIVSILGLCPKCDGWFSCDDFFDVTVAMPCCPQCQLAPAKVDYRFPAATKAAEVPAEGTAAPLRSTDQQGGATAGIDHPENSTATVITVDGALDAESMARLLDMLAAQYVDGDVAIDLSGVTMTSPSAVRGLVARLSAWGDTATLRIVCDRLAPRRLLRKWGGTSLPLASTMTAALASLAAPRVRRQ